jgi:hypothetical protein
VPGPRESSDNAYSGGSPETRPTTIFGAARHACFVENDMDERPIGTDTRTGTIRRIPALSMMYALLFVAAALQFAPALADEVRGPAGSVTAGAPDAAPQWVSGGVGEEARAEMLAVASAYNVHVLFSRADGAYLAGVPFTVADNAGRVLQTGISDGPLLYIKLKPGAYQISADFAGVKQSKRFRLGAGRSSTTLSFVARSE